MRLKDLELLFKIYLNNILKKFKRKNKKYDNVIYLDELYSKEKDKTFSDEFVRKYYENMPDDYDYNGFGKYYKNLSNNNRED